MLEKFITRIKKLLVAKKNKLWKELQVAQGKVELLTLQIANVWEN
jgi:hypothetical protein